MMLFASAGSICAIICGGTLLRVVVWSMVATKPANGPSLGVVLWSTRRARFGRSAGRRSDAKSRPSAWHFRRLDRCLQQHTPGRKIDQPGTLPPRPTPLVSMRKVRSGIVACARRDGLRKVDKADYMLHVAAGRRLRG